MEGGGEEAVAVSWACATRATRALGGGGLGDPGYAEGLDAACWVEIALEECEYASLQRSGAAYLFGSPTIDYISNAGDSDRRLRNIGRNDN